MIKFSYQYSVDKEAGYVKNILKKLSWYQKNGYNPILPTEIDDKNSDSEIIKVVKSELETNIKLYQKFKKEVKIELRRIAIKLNAFIDVLNYPIPKRILVVFTRYGPGGSYNLPNKIIVRIDKNSSTKKLLQTIIHETIHLIIEKPVIQKYKISHWEKENLVNSFFEHPKLKILFPDYQFPPKYSFPKDKINLIKFK